MREDTANARKHARASIWQRQGRQGQGQGQGQGGGDGMGHGHGGGDDGGRSIRPLERDGGKGSAGEWPEMGIGKREGGREGGAGGTRGGGRDRDLPRSFWLQVEELRRCKRIKTPSSSRPEKRDSPTSSKSSASSAANKPEDWATRALTCDVPTSELPSGDVGSDPGASSAIGVRDFYGKKSKEEDLFLFRLSRRATKLK
eukprot:746470-Hanusia_phi.AAC.2